MLVTFDDGYRSLVREAVPVLQELDAPSVVFVPTAFVGGTNAFDAGEEPDEPICSWDDLTTLAANRVAIQSHGVNHAAMSDLDAGARRAELEQSRSTQAGCGPSTCLRSRTATGPIPAMAEVRRGLSRP